MSVTLRSRWPAIEAKRPPSDAPNVLMVLLDDVGFGASSAFGGPIPTPTAERLANNGLKYTRFHTTALCSPTRAALLSGRNHHQVGMGHITETATPSPGYRSTRPNSTTPLAEILRQSGYNTAQFGKCHEVPVWESGPTGPFDHWPSNSGFERFYGFIGGETNQWAPALIDGVSTVDPPDDPDYHLMEDLTKKTIAFIREQKTLTPDKPFFTYFAPGATHTPHHVPKEWIEKYKGRFDDGWDARRAATVARQKELGVIPAAGDLTDRPEGISAWDDVDDAWKPILCRQMEVYAGFLENADTHVGRLVDALEELGILEDTLILYIGGDKRRVCGGRAQRRVHDHDGLQRRRRIRNPGVLDRASRRPGRAPTPTTTTPSGGPTPCVPRISGPSRWPRTMAGRATARSSTGRPRSTAAARSAVSGTT